MTAFRTLGGTTGFLAPEILSQNGPLHDEFLAGKCEYMFSVDIWSMGEIIYRLVSGTHPFAKGLSNYIRGKERFPTQMPKELAVSNSRIVLIKNL